MRQCQDCGKEYPSSMVVDGKRRFFPNRKFCLECSPFGTHNTSKRSRKAQITDPIKSRKERLKYGSYMRDYMNRRSKEMKLKALTMCGSKCVICGYSKYHGALDFHHLDSAQKEHGVGNMYKWSWEKIKKEVEKCVLLCATCHREVEAGVTQLNLIVPVT